MILGIIVFIFCLLGVFGFYQGDLTFTYIGLVLGIIEHIIGITTGQEKGLATLWFAILIAIGATIAGNPFWNMLSICVCFENVICFSLGVLLLIIMYFKNSEYILWEKRVKIPDNTTEKSNFERAENEWEEYLKTNFKAEGTRTYAKDVLVKETDIFCTNCGKKISENWNFCNHCGYKLK